MDCRRFDAGTDKELTMNREEIEELKNAAEQYSDILGDARKKVAEEKGKSMVSGTEVLDEKQFEEYLEKHSKEKDYEYLVRGAKLVCNCGSHKRMLNLPECHGVYIGENPMVHEYDCVQGINGQGNISWFGICRSERSQELPGKKVCYELTEENSADGTVGETELGKMCHPVIVGVWQDVYEKTKIVDYWEEVEEKEAEEEDAEEEDAASEERLCTLTTGSFLVCNYGGIIQPITSGQEYEMQEEDLGDNKDTDGNDINPRLWNEIEEARKAGYGECGNENCPLAHERHMDGDETDHGNIHGTNYFTVVFQYEDKRIIDKQNIKKGESAEIPTELEEREGYVFTGWDKEANNVSEDTVVTTVYEKDWIGAIDDIEEIEKYDAYNKKFTDEQVYTVKYVSKVLLREGYKVNFVCGVMGNILAEGAKAGFFENSNYDKQDPKVKPKYLKHMDKYHHYRPGSIDEDSPLKGTEKISKRHIYDLSAGTGIFSRQLCWNRINNRFECNDFANHKFGLGICQWTDPGNNPGNNSGQIQEKDLGRLPKLIKRYLDKFGEYAHPDKDECLELETAYLLEEFNSNKYSSIAGIDKSDCTLEDAAKDFLDKFEHPGDWQNKIPARTEYAKAVLEAFKGVGIDGQNITN